MHTYLTVPSQNKGTTPLCVYISSALGKETGSRDRLITQTLETMTTDLKTFAIFGTDHGHTDRLEYVAEGADEEGAFDAFDDDILSDTGEEEGWDWHVYEIPSEIAGDSGDIYEYVSGRSPTTITS